jgi:ABC-2 type transport system permease protein
MFKDLQLYRAWAIVLRHTRHIVNSFSRVSDMFYWPLVDIILWGYSGIWVGEGHEYTSSVALVLLTAPMLWQLVIRINSGVSVNLLEEIWSHNVSNLFCTPLQLTEWMLGVVILSLIGVVLTAAFLVIMLFGIYSFNIAALGWGLIPICLSLTLAGMSIGFLASALLIYWGYKVDAFAFMIGWAFAPVSGVYYPIEVLPYWAQLFASIFPMPYIFDALRQLLNTGILPTEPMLISFVLNIIYLLITLWFFKFMFEKSRQKGLSRLAG